MGEAKYSYAGDAKRDASYQKKMSIEVSERNLGFDPPNVDSRSSGIAALHLGALGRELQRDESRSSY